MGANESNSEPTSQQSDGDNRDADHRIEESGDLLARVRSEQREFEARINSLTRAVTEYAQILADIRELRIQRTQERSIVVEAELERPHNSHREVDYGYPGVAEQPHQNVHTRKRGLSR